MMYIWTLVLVISTSPHVQIKLMAEFRTEADCRQAIQEVKLDDDEKAMLKCLPIGYLVT